MRVVIFIFVCLICKTSYSQKILELNYHSLFGKQKSFQFFNNSKLDYKLKGDLLYRTHKLVNLNDSLLIFDNDEVVRISQLKAIKIRGIMISPYFFGAGILFFLLDTGNNIGKGHANIINEQAVLVSSICILTGIILKRIQDKHVYIRKSVTIRILDTDYQNLNIKK
jgi:hypothetical protein